MTRNHLVALVVAVFIATQAYAVAQSYYGRVDIIDALYGDCLDEARSRARIAYDPKVEPALRMYVAELTRRSEPERRELCRRKHPSATFKPAK